MRITPHLDWYDIVLLNLSGGKDSQALLDSMVERATAAGVLDRVVVVHADLGRVEWPGTRELAEEHATHYGLPFIAVTRPQGDLLHQIEHQRRKFPDAARRYCTSDHKTNQVKRVITRLVDEHIARHPNLGRPVRVLNCLGLRADESPARAKKPVFSKDNATNGKRHVDRWLPIHDWTEADVWKRIGEAGTRPHPAYAAGMPRLSCVFCVLASKSALVRAAQLLPSLAEEYRRVEFVIDHDFRQGLPMAEIIRLAAAAPNEPVQVDSWAA